MTVLHRCLSSDCQEKYLSDHDCSMSVRLKIEGCLVLLPALDTLLSLCIWTDSIGVEDAAVLLLSGAVMAAAGKAGGWAACLACESGFLPH